MKRKRKPILLYRIHILVSSTQKIKFCMQKNFSETVCLRTKFDLRLKKKQTIFGAKFQNYLKISKFQNFHIYKLYGKHFFSKNILNQFFCHQSVQLFSKSRRNGLIFFFCFSKMYENCMTSILSYT